MKDKIGTHYKKNYTKDEIEERESLYGISNRMTAWESSQICELFKDIPKEAKPGILRECFAMRR